MAQTLAQADERRKQVGLLFPSPASLHSATTASRTARQGVKRRTRRCALQAAAERPVDMAAEVSKERGRLGRPDAGGASGSRAGEAAPQAAAAQKMEVDPPAAARCPSLAGRACFICVSLCSARTSRSATQIALACLCCPCCKWSLRGHVG